VSAARLRVRRARRGDLETLAALEAHFPTDRIPRAGFRHLLTRANAQVWVCETRAGVCADAVILFRRRSSIARVYSIVVQPAFRGHGVARRLMQAAEAAAGARGARYMRLEVRPGNVGARALYRELGYEPQERINEFYEDGAAALRMTKPLNGPSRRRAR
jgi:[ribosomal protein S18]-alanine N-acetyltransferase